MKGREGQVTRKGERKSDGKELIERGKERGSGAGREGVKDRIGCRDRE